MCANCTVLAELLKKTHSYNEPLLSPCLASLDRGHWPFPPTPTFSELMRIFFFLLFLHVSPRHAHAVDAERCGSVTLSRQLRSALLWSGAAARDCNQGQGSLTAGC